MCGHFKCFRPNLSDKNTLLDDSVGSGGCVPPLTLLLVFFASNVPESVRREHTDSVTMEGPSFPHIVIVLDVVIDEDPWERVVAKVMQVVGVLSFAC